MENFLLKTIRKYFYVSYLLKNLKSAKRALSSDFTSEHVGALARFSY